MKKLKNIKLVSGGAKAHDAGCYEIEWEKDPALGFWTLHLKKKTELAVMALLYAAIAAVLLVELYLTGGL